MRVAEIDKLAGFIPEPYQTTRVMEWAALQEFPFTMRDAVNAIGLPKSVIHRILGRQFKKGTLTRTQFAVPFRTSLGGDALRPTYLYSLAGRDDA